MKINEKAEKIIKMMNDAGEKTYCVGGCVRDILLGKEPHDFDICTSAHPEKTEEILKEFPVIETGIKHGTVTVLVDGEPFEITTWRIDGKYSDNRRPENVTFTPSLEEDLKRRDFTINAMAFDGEEVIDPFGGKEDLKNGIIRAVGNPNERFEEDALRILRALRFASKLGFEIETIENENDLKLIGGKNITIKSKQVKDYKDTGIMNNGKKLNSDEYFAYTRLKDVQGTYKYNYIVKTNKGIKKLTRNIKVADETDSRCFAFNNGAIEHYYYFMDNDSTKEKCPMDVIIPKQINGQNVIAIDAYAFTRGCNDNIVMPTSSKNDYEIKFMTCQMSGMGINSVELPDTLEIVEYDAFFGNNLKSITIPKRVKEIKYNAFANNKLQSVTFEGNVNNISIVCDAFRGAEHSKEVNSIGGVCK